MITTPLIQRVADSLAQRMQTVHFQKRDFPWDEFSLALSEVFELPDCSCSCHEIGWVDRCPLVDEPNAIAAHFVLDPLEAGVALYCYREDLARLMALLFHAKKEGASLYPPVWIEQFHDILLAEAISLCELHQIWAPCVPRRIAAKERISGGGFCCKVHCKVADLEMVVTLFLPEPFCTSWATYEKQHPPIPRIATSLPMQLALSIGDVKLSAAELQSLQIGDLLFLDRCHYLPAHDLYKAILLIEGLPAFEGDLSAHELELCTVLLETRGEPMDAHQEPSPATSTAAALDQLPLEVHVEVAKIEMTWGEVSALSPGNVIPIQSHPDLGVTLTVHQKVIAHGEIVQLGDTIGIRITSF